MLVEGKRVCIDCAVREIIPIKGKTNVGSMKCNWCGKLSEKRRPGDTLTTFGPLRIVNTKGGEIYLATDKVEVKLVYFKPSGKYYSSGSFMVDAVGLGLWNIFELVQEKAVARKLPGLLEGHSEFIVHISVPWHPHNHPCLVNTESVLRQEKGPRFLCPALNEGDGVYRP